MLEDIIQERKKKLTHLCDEGVDPYPARLLHAPSKIGEIKERFLAHEEKQDDVSIAGRIRSIRDQGKIIFCDIEDFSGKIQIIAREESLKEFQLLKETLDVGDFISVTGKALTTQRGEQSIAISHAQILAKSIRPIPSDFYGLEDVETRLRQRHLDALLNKEIRELFIKKAAFWGSLRSFLEKEGFIGIDMPVLEAVPGGAEAEPFLTHHNALDQDFYLRISLEIALKKALVGGFEKVYELGRIFRNEGVDASHLQDYTQLEFYWAYADYKELMTFVQTMYRAVIQKTIGSLKQSYGEDVIDWEKEWTTVSYVDVFKKHNNDIDPVSASLDVLKNRAHELSIDVTSTMGRGRLIDLIFKKTVRPTLIQPCFLIDPPVAIEPLAKRKTDNPELVERFQIVACGTELGKGFSEANDPLDQRKRFEEQMKLRHEGDAEAHMLDEDFLEALEYGMPPAAGFGLSERLFAVLLDKPVRETVFFPPMKKKNSR